MRREKLELESSLSNERGEPPVLNYARPQQAGISKRVVFGLLGLLAGMLGACTSVFVFPGAYWLITEWHTFTGEQAFNEIAMVIIWGLCLFLCIRWLRFAITGRT